jgi:hypothetical protein
VRALRACTTTPKRIPLSLCERGQGVRVNCARVYLSIVTLLER